MSLGRGFPREIIASAYRGRRRWCDLTQLALQVAFTLVSERIRPYGDGIYFVSLVGVSTPSAVVSILADALGFLLADTEAPEQQLLSHLRTHQCLLILET
jgi:hypothetical protein